MSDPARPVRFAPALQAVEEGIRDGQREVVVALDAVGTELHRKEGIETEVELSDDDMGRMRGAAVLTHNHPGPGGRSFSPDDLATACVLRVTELRVVTRSWTHSISHPAGPLKPELWDEVWDTLAKASQDVRAEFQAAINSGTLSRKDAEAEAWHEVWTRVAKVEALDYARWPRQGR